MERRSWFGAVIGVVVLAILGYAGLRTFGYSNADECYACRRPIHAHSKTVAVVNGHARLFCCPACALSQREQAGRPIRVTQLTSFQDGKAVAPENAYVVRGSNVNMCERTQELIQEDKRPADLHYDRCAPSLIAFAQRSEALEFARKQGGEVVAFQEAAAALVQ
jgi:hypothetical protein